MSRRKGKSPAGSHAAAMRRVARAEYVEALRDGRRDRPQTFKDRKKEASRTACRGNPEA